MIFFLSGEIHCTNLIKLNKNKNTLTLHIFSSQLVKTWIHFLKNCNYSGTIGQSHIVMADFKKKI